MYIQEHTSSVTHEREDYPERYIIFRLKRQIIYLCYRGSSHFTPLSLV